MGGLIMEKIKIKIAFGTEIARYYKNHGILPDEDDNSEDYYSGSVVEREFNTPHELSAYLHGIEDMDGWREYVVVE